MRIGVLTVVNTKLSEAWHLVILHVGATAFKELAKSIFRVEGLKVEVAALSNTLSTESHWFIFNETIIILKLITLRKQ